MKSMTGYGRGECSQGGVKITVELSSVNRKQGEIALSLPRELESLEGQVRETIHGSVSRGRLVARVVLHLGERAWAGRLRLNHALAKAYAREFKRLGRELGLETRGALEWVLRSPGVMQTEAQDGAGERYWPILREALGKALGALVRMRQREGGHLAADLGRRLRWVRGAVGRVRKVAPRVVEQYREQLRVRIQSAGLGLPDSADERLLKEVVYFADRSDISEELTRLDSHCAQFAECLASEGAVGRTLDFLVQEMNREVNTIGSKASDARIAGEVVRLKTELEKVREQVQNVE
jgi:uncharacterized protein (TIGR00255 family)